MSSFESLQWLVNVGTVLCFFSLWKWQKLQDVLIRKGVNMGAVYQAPTLVQLRLEKKVAQAADKWWKVEEWLKIHADVDEPDDPWESPLVKEFVSFVVKLREDK